VFGIFLLRQFFMQIPQDLFDAALIDGSGHLRYLFTIVLPLSKPALVSVALINFIWAWDSFKWPLLVTRDSNMRVLAVGSSSSWSARAAQHSFDDGLFGHGYCAGHYLLLFHARILYRGNYHHRHQGLRVPFAPLAFVCLPIRVTRVKGGGRSRQPQLTLFARA